MSPIGFICGTILMHWFLHHTSAGQTFLSWAVNKIIKWAKSDE